MAEETTTEAETEAASPVSTEMAKEAVAEGIVDDVSDGATAATTDDARSARKVREGTVVSDKMDKTAVVAVVSRAPHARYNKMVLRTTKLQAHDETNDVNIGDKVRIMETRPMSKHKRWRISDVLERAK